MHTKFSQGAFHQYIYKMYAPNFSATGKRFLGPTSMVSPKVRRHILQVTTFIWNYGMSPTYNHLYVPPCSSVNPHFSAQFDDKSNNTFSSDAAILLFLRVIFQYKHLYLSSNHGCTTTTNTKAITQNEYIAKV